MGGIPALNHRARPADRRLRVVVVGAGPAGLMAAGEAAGGGAAVTLLDGEDRPGKKLLLTGKGRCNLSNTLPLERFLEGFGANGVFLRNACHRFFSAAAAGVPRRDRRRDRRSSAAAGSTRPTGGRLRSSTRCSRGSGNAACGVLTGRRVTRGDPRARRRVSRGRGRLRGARRPRGAGRRRGLLPADRLPRRRLPDRGGARAPHRRAPPGARPGRLPRAVFQAPRGSASCATSGSSRRPAGHPAIESFGEVHATPFGISGPAVFPVSAAIGALAAAAPVPAADQPQAGPRRGDARRRAWSAK